MNDKKNYSGHSVYRVTAPVNTSQQPIATVEPIKV